jgi:hypothetical protein
LDPPQDIASLMKKLVEDNPIPPRLILDEFRPPARGLSPAAKNPILPPLFSPAPKIGTMIPPPSFTALERIGSILPPLASSPAAKKGAPPARQDEEEILSYKDLREMISSPDNWYMISELPQWDELYYKSMNRLTFEDKERIFQLLLKKGFTITSAKKLPDEARQMSFFRIIAEANSEANSMMDHKKFYQETLDYIKEHIEDFTESILNEEGFELFNASLYSSFLRHIESGQGGENTILKAVQKVLAKKGINRPIYLYKATVKPEIVHGDLLPPSFHRFEGAGRHSDQAIRIYVHDDGTCDLLTKIKK